MLTWLPHRRLRHRQRRRRRLRFLAQGRLRAFNADGSLSQRLTLPPLATSRCAIASPMPAAPPVMTAVRPSKSSRFISRAPIEISRTIVSRVVRPPRSCGAMRQGVGRDVATEPQPKKRPANPKVTGRRDTQLYSRVVVSVAL